QRMYCFNTGENGHQAKGITIKIELSTIQAWPIRNARTYEPSFKAGITEFTFGRENWFVIIVTWIEAASQCVDDGMPVLQNEVPAIHIDGNTLCLNVGDGLGAVLRPKNHMIGVETGKSV